MKTPLVLSSLAFLNGARHLPRSLADSADKSLSLKTYEKKLTSQ